MTQTSEPDNGGYRNALAFIGILVFLGLVVLGIEHMKPEELPTAAGKPQVAAPHTPKPATKSKPTVEVPVGVTPEVRKLNQAVQVIQKEYGGSGPYLNADEIAYLLQVRMPGTETEVLSPDQATEGDPPPAGVLYVSDLSNADDVLLYLVSPSGQLYNRTTSQEAAVWTQVGKYTWAWVDVASGEQLVVG